MLTLEKIELYFWMLRNCHYYEQGIDNLPELVSEYPRDHIPLEVAVTYIPGFQIKLEDFEKRVGEVYSYEKHLLPLIKENLIYCGNFERFNANLKMFDSILGTVKNYELGIVYVRFWLGCHPDAKRIE